MSFGKMNTFVDIVSVTKKKDSEGFTVDSEEVLASVRAYREGRHGSQRSIPGIGVTTDHILVCEDGRFDITSVEDVKSRGMYVEVLAKKVVSTVGKG